MPSPSVSSRVRDRAVLARHQQMLLEAEGAAEELDGGGRVVVAHGRDDLRGHVSSSLGWSMMPFYRVPRSASWRKVTGAGRGGRQACV